MGSLSKYEVDPFDVFEEYDTLLITENADIKNAVVGRVIVKGSSIKINVSNARVGKIYVKGSSCTINIGEGADVGNMPSR